MTMHRRKTSALIFSAALFVSTIAASQTQNEPKPAESASKQQAAAPKNGKKQLLTDVTRVSTDEAAKEAAKSAAGNRGDAKPSADPSDAAVQEFRPVEHSEGGAVLRNTRDSKKTHLKNVHGNVYGTGGAAGNAEGGAVGASTKSGKTSIYVESGRSRQSTPPPPSR